MERSQQQPHPDCNQLAALARKYRTLAELRRARAAGAPVPARSIFRALAAEFPGALRELDTVELADLDHRAAALEHAQHSPSALEPWMSWLHGYHLWMRAALMIKLRTARSSDRSIERIQRVTDDVSKVLGLVLDPEFTFACADPPAGRLRPIVLARVAALHRTSIEQIRAALFPTRTRDE